MWEYGKRTKQKTNYYDDKIIIRCTYKKKEENGLVFLDIIVKRCIVLCSHPRHKSLIIFITNTILSTYNEIENMYIFIYILVKISVVHTPHILLFSSTHTNYMCIAYLPNTLSKINQGKPTFFLIFFPQQQKRAFLSKKVIYITIRLNSKAIIS